MLRRKLAASLIGAGLIVSGVMVAPGCGGDEGQPSRESISPPPRGSGGVQGAAGEKGKGGKIVGEAPKGGKGKDSL
jgi:hypothetical protein